jgi:hypothetical protein
VYRAGGTVHQDLQYTCTSQKSVNIEIIDFLAQTCQPFIHDEDDAELAL